MTPLIRPVITEKTMKLASQHQYTFAVDRRANVLQIEAAIVGQYKVSVVGVRTLTVLGKQRRSRKGIGQTSRWKKAIVTVEAKDKIPGFELETEEKADKKTVRKSAAGDKSEK